MTRPSLGEAGRDITPTSAAGTELDALVADGQRALADGAWARARELFGRVLECEARIAAYLGLGTAARYMRDRDAAIAAHETAFRLARDAGDDDAAAAAAVQLSYDAYAFRGPAEAMGWVERAAMLVDGRPATAATAFIPFVRAYLALLAHHDPEAGRSGAAEAAAIARSVGAVDIELLALSLEGLSLVALGRIAEGMRKLDAAAAGAVGGEMVDADSIETVCCLLIDACKRVRDLERANEWCLRVREIATRYDDRQMFNVCRVHYADVLVWQGELARADGELRVAARELGQVRPEKAADALVRLAEIRRRHGDAGEAERLLAEATSHRLHALVEGHLALDRAEVGAAVDAAERFLRRIGDADLFERVAGLELAVRARVAAGDLAGAAAAADEIAAIAGRTSSAPLQAAALLAAGRLLTAEADFPKAIAALEDAADMFDRAGARFDAAQTRRELADAHGLAGRPDQAERIAARATQEFAAMGIVSPARADPTGLSRREAEVLRLVARGLSNEDIAGRLVLSVRTVERHVANVYGKIGASGRTARAIATAWAHTHGIT